VVLLNDDIEGDGAMRERLRSLFGLVKFNGAFLYILEAALIGLFFIQALRYLIGTLYAHVASAALYPAIDPAIPGVVEPSTVNGEIIVLFALLTLPLLALVLGRFHRLMVVAALMVAVGRYLMLDGETISPVSTGAITVGGGLLYLALLVRHRARVLPYMFILALGLDQLFRAAGDTFDPSLYNFNVVISLPPFDTSFTIQYAVFQIVFSVLVGALALFAAFGRKSKEKREGEDERVISPDVGLMPVWGGIGLGALLFLQLSLLALPNAIGGRADMDYTLLVPLVMMATLLPLVPWLQDRARRFIGLFDRSVRGWSWMLLTMLLLVFGIRLDGLPAGIALILAQFMVNMMWWWLVRPQAQKERNFTGLWIILAIGVFMLLMVFDTFTYEYAFVRDFSQELDVLNPIIPPLLRGFRGMGLAVILLAIFFAVLPMTQMRQRIAWTSIGAGRLGYSFLAVIFMLGFSFFASYLARPPVVQGVNNPETIRVGTYNIHSGFSEFYDYDLEALALTIQYSGANVVLLQEIEAGRMTSFGVDQVLWLARRLEMDARFYPTNEGLQGLAVLSNVEIVYDDGALLDSTGLQTGLQRVQVRPDVGVITIYNTWLEPLLDTGVEADTASMQQEQLNQLMQIFGIIIAHHSPSGQLGRTIIGGTFNNVPDSDLVDLMIANDFTDYFSGMPLERSATFRRTDAVARLDYLWATMSGNFRGLDGFVVDPVNAGFLAAHPSDHRMAVVLIQVQ
jgi:endonuclease/exonuclease/phosphatase family metal-dependent hydrolase